MLVHKGEIKKAEKSIEKKTGIACNITGCGWKDDPELPGFVEVIFEMCDKLTGKLVGYVTMQIVEFDHRRSFVSMVEA